MAFAYLSPLHCELCMSSLRAIAMALCHHSAVIPSLQMLAASMSQLTGGMVLSVAQFDVLCIELIVDILSRAVCYDRWSRFYHILMLRTSLFTGSGLNHGQH